MTSMTDNEKSAIVAIGLTVGLGIIVIALLPVSPILSAIISGPGWLTYALIRRYSDSCLLVWLGRGIPQFLFIYFFSILLYKHRPFWRLQFGLLIFLWLICAYAGYHLLAGSVIAG